MATTSETWYGREVRNLLWFLWDEHVFSFKIPHHLTEVDVHSPMRVRLVRK
jgi:hypothetical protein